MARLARWAGPILLGAGVGLVAHAVAVHAANLLLLAVIPVVTGSSAEFLLGLLLLLAGIFLLPLAFVAAEAGHEERSSTEPPSADRPSRAGGLVLVGPVPIFFGRWRGTSGHPYWVAVAFGLALLVVAFILFFVL